MCYAFMYYAFGIFSAQDVFFLEFLPSEMMSTCVRNVKKHWEPPSFRDTAQGKLPRFWKIGVGN